ncbi:hypothetical protein BaRGS_00035489 [Batillaria attramentaria]|uniref:Uncharacterized protein n=1 Tax=Batillaria attramentaria TaxID=370345 RepID=A0ABD0JDU0_9CAEN
MKAIDTVLANQDSSVGALFPFVRHIPGDPFKARKTICDYRVCWTPLSSPSSLGISRSLDGGPNPPDDFITAYLRRVRQDEADQKVSYITEEGLPLLSFIVCCRIRDNSNHTALGPSSTFFITPTSRRNVTRRSWMLSALTEARPCKTDRK